MRSKALNCLAQMLAVLGAGCAADPTPRLAEPEVDSEFQRAMALVGAGDAVATLSALEAWIDTHPDAQAGLRAEAHRQAADACARLYLIEGGLSHTEASIALAPDVPWTHYARGVALNKTGEYEEALNAFTRALELDPDHIKAAQWRGRTYFLVGRPAEAVLDYDIALAITATSDDAVLSSWGENRRQLTVKSLLGRADALDALGEYDAAEADRAAAWALTEHR